MDDYEQFMAHVDVRGPDECHPWKGPWRDGDPTKYGRFYLHGKVYTAHRWLLGHLRGKPLILKPTGLEDGCHHCDNPPCCNPAHLYVGTREQNVGDAVERTRLWQLKKDTCPKGHPLDGVKVQLGKERRYCKQCERDGQHRRQVALASCKNGHPLEGDNVLLCKNGTRKCRICDAARAAAVRPERRAAAIAAMQAARWPKSA